MEQDTSKSSFLPLIHKNVLPQLAEDGSAVVELERVRAQNSMLQKLARTLQQEVKALKSMNALGGDSATADKALLAAAQDPHTADPQPSNAW